MLINRRSAGIKDLRFVYIVDDERSTCAPDTYHKSHPRLRRPSRGPAGANGATRGTATSRSTLIIATTSDTHTTSTCSTFQPSTTPWKAWQQKQSLRVTQTSTFIEFGRRPPRCTAGQNCGERSKGDHRHRGNTVPHGTPDARAGRKFEDSRRAIGAQNAPHGHILEMSAQWACQPAAFSSSVNAADVASESSQGFSTISGHTTKPKSMWSR